MFKARTSRNVQGKDKWKCLRQGQVEMFKARTSGNVQGKDKWKCSSLYCIILVYAISYLLDAVRAS